MRCSAAPIDSVVDVVCSEVEQEQEAHRWVWEIVCVLVRPICRDLCMS